MTSSGGSSIYFVSEKAAEPSFRLRGGIGFPSLSKSSRLFFCDLVSSDARVSRASSASSKHPISEGDKRGEVRGLLREKFLGLAPGETAGLYRTMGMGSVSLGMLLTLSLLSFTGEASLSLGEFKESVDSVCR